MPDEKELLHELGAFDSMEASRLLPLLEQSGIPFEVETDDVHLDPAGLPALQFGSLADQPKLIVFMTAHEIPRAIEIARSIFPDFKPPAKDDTRDPATG
jgi:hypothetical protein